MTGLAYDEIVSRRRHPAWRLLQADHAPLVLGFLIACFLEPNRRELQATEVSAALEDYLTAVRDEAHPYPRSAEAYLKEWADPSVGWLRGSYPTGSDELHYAPTAAVEIAVGLCRELGPREFVGTSSRLLTIRDLLRQITVGSSEDPQERIDALRRQRADVDDQLAKILSGEDTRMDATAVRERYQQIVATGQELLADLRAVEDNFRTLDRQVRAQAVSWDGPRGQFLEAVFGSTAQIGDSDQGRSWTAFWELMLSTSQQDELEQLLKAVEELDALRGRTGQVERVLRTDLFDAATATMDTVRALSGQLRRFLDDAEWAESRRIHTLLRQALAAALELRDDDNRKVKFELPDLRADISMPVERPLRTPYTPATLDAPELDAETAPVDLTALMSVQHVDTERLRDCVRATVAEHGGVTSLGDIVAAHPLTLGLAELVGYLQISASEGGTATTDTQRIGWTDDAGVHRIAELPLVIFTSVATAAAGSARGPA